MSYAYCEFEIIFFISGKHNLWNMRISMTMDIEGYYSAQFVVITKNRGHLYSFGVIY